MEVGKQDQLQFQQIVRVTGSIPEQNRLGVEGIEAEFVAEVERYEQRARQAQRESEAAGKGVPRPAAQRAKGKGEVRFEHRVGH